jgi:hypothetical protein
MNKLKTFAVICFVLVLTSCSVTEPLTATGNPIGNKIGTAKATQVLGLCFGGNASILTAAKNGGISKISTVDVKRRNILFIVMSQETTVSGE